LGFEKQEAIIKKQEARKRSETLEPRNKCWQAGGREGVLGQIEEKGSLQP
jgi:hypothetical protein